MGRARRISRRVFREKDLPSLSSPFRRHQSIVNTLKTIYLTAVQLVQQISQLPKKTVKAFRHWRQRGARRELEAERLDRIRNPSKYHCK